MTSCLNHICKNLTGLVTLILLSALTSCIGDDMDGCPAGLSLRFEYTLNESYDDLFAGQVTHLDLCLYDKDGYYIRTYKLLQSQLENGNTFPLSLPAGSYTFVTWANMPVGGYECTSDPRLEDVLVKLNVPPSAEAGPVHGSLFHGVASQTLDAAAGNRQTISLTKNTHLLHVLLEETGNTYPLELGDYTIHINGINGIYT